MSKEANDAKYRAIIDNARVGILQTTPEGRILTANPALARMFGYDFVDELLSTVKDVRTHYADPSRRREMEDLLRENGAVEDFEIELRRRGGGALRAPQASTSSQTGRGWPATKGRSAMSPSARGLLR